MIQHVKTVGAAAASGPLVLPLALRHIRRNLSRSLFLVVGIGLLVYVYLLSGSYMGRATGLALKDVAAPPLPADMVFLKNAGNFISGSKALKAWAEVNSFEELYIWETETSVGQVRTAALVTDGSMLRQRMTLAAGQWFSDAKQVLLPAGLAQAAGLGVGDSFHLLRYSSGRAVATELTVIGLYQISDLLLNGPILAPGALGLQGPTQGNTIISDVRAGRSVSTAARKTANYLEADRVITQEAAREYAARLISGSFSTTRQAVFLTFILGGLGILNIKLLAFLQRKRKMGILKAVGLDNVEMVSLLLLEGLILFLVGATVGATAAAITVEVLNRTAAEPYAISAFQLVLAIVLAMLVFLMAAWLPARLCQKATVDQLLHNRRVYVNPNPSCAQCGRCGGF
ncbi:MAG: ABC transporter permease [Bacillota bacterium]